MDITGSKIRSYYGNNFFGNSAICGTTINGNTASICVTRYEFTTGNNGATRIEFTTNRAYCDIVGDSQSLNSIYYIRFAFGTGESTYIGYIGTGGYGYPGTASAGMSIQSATDSTPGYVRGWLNYNFKPNTTYYLWLFPGQSFTGMTRFSLGGKCTLTLTGTYGTPSTISASNGKFGSAIPVTLSNSVSGVTHTLTVTCAGETTTLINNTTAKTATWTPAVATYAPLITGAKSTTATFSCVTRYNGTQLGEQTEKTITVSFNSADVAPSIGLNGIAITYDNTGTSASGITRFVQGYSKAKATITASSPYGASISSYAMTIKGAKVSGASNVLTSATLSASGTVTASVTVTDSRGFTATATKNFSVDAYSPPTLTNVSIFRCDGDGTANEAGDHYSAYAIKNIAPLGGQNTYTMTVAHKTINGSYVTEETLPSGTVSVFPNLSPDLNPDATYIVRITITDALGNSTNSTENLPGQNWGLKFTVANSKVDACGIGKAPEANKVLEIPGDWNIIKTENNVTERALFESDLNDLNVKTYNSVEQFNLTSGSATISNAWNALPNGAILYADFRDFAAGQCPSNAGMVEMVKSINASGTQRGYIFAHGEYNYHLEWRMYINNSGLPTGTWLIIPTGFRIEVGQNTTGSSGTASVTFGTAFSSTPRIICSAQGTSTNTVFDARPGNVSTSGFTIYCTRQSGSTTSLGTSITVNWIAIGS